MNLINRPVSQFKKLLFVLFSVLLNLTIYAQITGKIDGKVTSETNENLPAVNIIVENTQLGTSTNNLGEFEISGIEEGEYFLVATAIGYKSQKKPFSVIPGQKVTVSFELVEGVELLNEFSLVETQREKYCTSVSRITMRSPMSLMEAPQSVQVITSKLLEDQQFYTLGEATSNASGITATSPFGETTGRGFASPNPPIHIYFNGIKGSMFSWPQKTQLYNVERIEFIKGPASVLFGDGTPGGIQNIETKRPQSQKQFQFTSNYSSWNSLRVTADATGALSKNKQLLYRLILGYEDANSFRDFQKGKNVFIAPSISLILGGNTLLDFELNYFSEDNDFANDRGIYATLKPGNVLDFGSSLNSFSAGSPSDFRLSNNLLATASLSHQFNTNLSVNLVSRYFMADIKYREHLPDFFSPTVENDTLSRLHLNYSNKRQGTQNTAFANYTIKKGIFGNEWVVGIDHSYVLNTSASQEGVAAPLNVLKPNYSKDLENYQDGYFWSDEILNNQMFGSYIQNKISIGKLSAIVGLRYEIYNQTRAKGKEFEQNKTKADIAASDVWIPRYGLVYNPVKNISVYGSYCQSFEPQTSNSRSNGTSYKDIAPKTGKQFELGYKGQFFRNNLTTELAIYQIDYVNILAVDVDLSDSIKIIEVLVPGARGKGVEIGVQGKIKDLGIVVNYAYNQSKYTQDNNFGKKDEKFPGSPDHIFNSWLKYTFSNTILTGLGLGFGAEYCAEKIGGFNASNKDFVLPSYTIFQSSMSYKIERWYLGLTIKNITNERYFIGAYNPGSIFIGAPLNFRTIVKYTIN